MQGVSVEDLREETKKFKSNKATGPSGITIEIVKRMDDENLKKIAGPMGKIIMGGDKCLPLGTRQY